MTGADMTRLKNEEGGVSRFDFKISNIYTTMISGYIFIYTLLIVFSRTQGAQMNLRDCMYCPINQSKNRGKKPTMNPK